mmetsp:Transcript_38790/g.112034  ORF Transcript_38790/g.112034 Transcript_38790/m.112034 type:complete len:241 (-) Transcript_38790:57-779(-)
MRRRTSRSRSGRKRRRTREVRPTYMAMGMLRKQKAMLLRNVCVRLLSQAVKSALVRRAAGKGRWPQREGVQTFPSSRNGCSAWFSSSTWTLQIYSSVGRICPSTPTWTTLKSLRRRRRPSKLPAASVLPTSPSAPRNAARFARCTLCGLDDPQKQATVACVKVHPRSAVMRSTRVPVSTCYDHKGTCPSCPRCRSMQLRTKSFWEHPCCGASDGATGCTTKEHAWETVWHAEHIQGAAPQ